MTGQDSSFRIEITSLSFARSRPIIPISDNLFGKRDVKATPLTKS